MSSADLPPGKGADADLAPIRLQAAGTESRPIRTTARRGPYRKSQQTRETILGAAMEVFSTQGFRSTSLAEIAERSGLDQSSIFYYFPSKTELLLAVMHERDRQADELLEAMAPRTLREIPKRLLELATRNATTPGVIELYTVLAAESLTPDHPLSAYFRDRTKRVREGFRGWFRSMADEGLLREGVDHELAAASFLAIWEGAQYHWLLEPAEVDVVANLRHFLFLVLRDENQVDSPVQPHRGSRRPSGT